jgi:uncharacterized protein
VRIRFRPRVLAAAFLAGAALLAASDLKVPVAPDRWVTDRAGFLTAATVASLDARLQAFEEETGHQVLVYVDRTTGDVPIEEWAVKTFEAWAVGRKGLDDGLVLFIMADDRRARIEVGYGLEDKVPDAVASRIIRGILLPGFREGRRDEAVTGAVSALLTAVGGTGAGEQVREPEQGRGRTSSVARTILTVIAVIFFLILFHTNPSLALWLLMVIFSGGRGGGSGGRGGGGFRGGGGRSGGGGASGSW